MTVSVSVETGRRAAAVAVPNDAISESSPGVAAVLAVRDGRARVVPVTLGLRGLAATEIVSGLAAGDRVLADAGNATVADGARVRVERRAAPAGEGDGATRRELPVSFD
jgi:HlyD family secretion protein